MRYLTRESKKIVIHKDEVGGDDTYEGIIGHQHLGGEAWRLDVGAECNLLLELAEDFEVTGTSEWKENTTNQQFAGVIKSIVARVAEFESLEKEEE